MPESLKSSIEIHDSILTSVERQAKGIKLSLEAYIHKSEGVPGVDSGTGWVQSVILTINDGSFEGNAENLPSDLADGTLQIDKEHLDNEIPIPLDRHGQVVLTLRDKHSGAWMVVRGGHIALELFGEAGYIEEFR